MTGHPRAAWLLGRLGRAAASLLVLSAIVFALTYLAPGDVARNLVGTRRASPELLASVRAQYHLDRALPVQYAYWLGSVARGDFGRSIRTRQPVLELIGSRTGLTLELALAALAIAVGVGIPLGVAAARHRGQALDRIIVGGSVVGVAAPSFAVGLLLLYVFSVMLGWLPVFGPGEGGLDRVRHLVLPAVALAIGLVAQIAKVTRVSMIRELGQDYATFGRARGLSRGAVVRACLRGASVPIVTDAGLLFAGLVGGTVLVETTFALPGLGGLLTDSILFKDIPVVQALTLLIAGMILVATALADVAVGLVDPRLRRGGRETRR